MADTIHCDHCGREVSDDDFKTGEAVREGGDTFCAKCAKMYRKRMKAGAGRQTSGIRHRTAGRKTRTFGGSSRRRTGAVTRRVEAEGEGQEGPPAPRRDNTLLYGLVAAAAVLVVVLALALGVKRSKKPEAEEREPERAVVEMPSGTQPAGAEPTRPAAEARAAGPSAPTEGEGAGRRPSILEQLRGGEPAAGGGWLVPTVPTGIGSSEPEAIFKRLIFGMARPDANAGHTRRELDQLYRNKPYSSWGKKAQLLLDNRVVWVAGETKGAPPLTLVNCSLAAEGKFGKALSPDVGAGYGETMPVGLDGPLKGFTVEAWVKRSKGGGTVAQRSGQFGLRVTASGELQAFFGQDSWAGGGDVPEGSWAHVAASWDGKQARVLLDGRVTAQAARSGPWPALGTGRGAEVPLQVAASGSPGAPSNVFMGLLDELRISSTGRYAGGGGGAGVSSRPAADSSTLMLFRFDGFQGE